MKEIEEYQHRILAALDRITALSDKVKVVDAPVDRSEEVDALTGKLQKVETDLQNERTVAEELRQRVQSLTIAAEKPTPEPIVQSTEKVENLQRQVQLLGVDVQRLKDANVKLRESNAHLHEQQGGGDDKATEINQSMQAELISLRAARAADVAEMDTILKELKPLMEGHVDA